MNKQGFMLLEAILTVIIVSICLTYICQSLWTNFRTGMRFQEEVRGLLVMQNRLGLLFATTAAEDQLQPYAKNLEAPYDKFTVTAQDSVINDHLKKVGLTVNWPQGRNQGALDASTIIYSPDVS